MSDNKIMNLRKSFAEALEVPAKEWGRNQDDGSGSFKYLGDKHIRVSPKRLAELADSGFAIALANKSAVARSKLITGIAASIYRTLSFLADKGLGDKNLHADEPGRGGLVIDLIKAYWPEVPENDAAEFRSASVQAWIRQGIIGAAQQVRTDRDLAILVNVVEWGPFSFVNERTDHGRAEAHFQFEYGRRILAAVDPVSFNAELSLSANGASAKVFQDVSFAKAMEDIPTSVPGKWRITLGVYDSLIRRYRGFSFVPFPIRIPVAGIIIGKADQIANVGQNELVEFLAGEAKAESSRTEPWAFVVKEESGHLFLGRMISNDQIGFIESVKSKEICDILLEISKNRDCSIIFTSDTILTSQVYTHLKVNNIDDDTIIKPLLQKEGHFCDFSFQTGFMIREEDQKLSNLIRAAHTEIFRSQWMSEMLLNYLLEKSECWMKALEIDWKFPLFAIDSECLAQLANTSVRGEQIISLVKSFGNLVDIGDIK
jgi:hypothetical protein